VIKLTDMPKTGRFHYPSK